MLYSKLAQMDLNKNSFSKTFSFVSAETPHIGLWLPLENCASSFKLNPVNHVFITTYNVTAYKIDYL